MKDRSLLNKWGIWAESGSIGAPPAIVGAILDALKPLGVTHVDMPATPARIWAAINRASSSPSP